MSVACMSVKPSAPESVIAICGLEVLWLKGDEGPADPRDDKDDSRLWEKAPTDFGVYGLATTQGSDCISSGSCSSPDEKSLKLDCEVVEGDGASEKPPWGPLGIVERSKSVRYVGDAAVGCWKSDDDVVGEGASRVISTFDDSESCCSC